MPGTAPCAGDCRAAGCRRGTDRASEEVLMAWYVYLAWFFAGAFLVNAIPHTVQGICGNRFQTPFATPPGVGESSAIVNVMWGLFNFAVGGALLHIFLPPELPPPWPLCIAGLIVAIAMT